MWSKLAAFVEGNPLVRLEAGRLQVADGATFVFGGDAVDRGPHSRRIIKTLLEAKRRQSTQVLLLAGNRDLNKLRLRRELTGHPPQKMPAEIRSQAPAERLKWIFSNTMGAAMAFEHRRTELGQEGRGASDEEVVESFLEDVREGGDHCEYLARCQLGLRIKKTLFVHGGVTPENFLAVPGQSRARDTDEWVALLNDWYRVQLDAVRADALDSHSWTQLMAYQGPLPGTRLNQTSVVYGRCADALNNPLLPPLAVREQLQSDGVARLVVGHTPNGDSPSILRAEGFEQLVADNSHARVSEGAKCLFDDDETSIDAHTELDDGTRHRVQFVVGLDERTPIGRRIRSSGELIKGRLSSGELLLFRYLPMFKCTQRAVGERALGSEELEAPE